MKIAVIGANSFIGKNVVENLKAIKAGKNRTRPMISISDIYIDENKDADVIIYLPGTDIKSATLGRIIVISEYDSDYDSSKNLQNALVYKLPTIVGKWQEPASGVARLCYAMANDEEYEISDLSATTEILFIDDLLEEIYDALEGHPHKCDFPLEGDPSPDPTAQYNGRTPIPNENGDYCYSPKAIRVMWKSIINRLESFNRLNSTLIVSEIPEDSLSSKLYSMYLSYLPERKMSYPVKMSMDNRGVFTELIKTVNNGQVSINIARPGNVRGQHWHNHKWEIFIVVSGHGLIQEREIGSDKVINFEVRGEEMRAVIMLPGYTHNIINLDQERDLVTVMFANEQFDQDHPDTFFEVVDESLDI